MRPYPNELLDSALHSLRDVLIPAISDDWALYVAKCLDKLLVDVQVRIANDLGHLARDTAEMAELFERLRQSAGDEPSGFDDLLAPATVEPVIAPELAEGLYERVSATNDAGRARLAELVDTLYAIERGEQPGSPAAANAAHALVREHLQRQLARDVELMSPVFMAFGDPQRVSK